MLKFVQFHNKEKIALVGVMAYFFNIQYVTRKTVSEDQGVAEEGEQGVSSYLGVYEKYTYLIHLI